MLHVRQVPVKKQGLQQKENNIVTHKPTGGCIHIHNTIIIISRVAVDNPLVHLQRMSSSQESVNLGWLCECSEMKHQASSTHTVHAQKGCKAGFSHSINWRVKGRN